MTLPKLWILWMDNYRAGNHIANVGVESEINELRRNHEHA